MKKLLPLMFTLVCFSLYTQAQETDAGKEWKRIKKEQKQMKTLDLNNNQGQQVKEINSTYRDAHKQIMQNDALTQEQKQERIRALNKKRVSDIHMIVGPDKAKQFEQMHQNNKEKDQAKKQNKNREKENNGKMKKEKKSKNE